MTKYRTVTLAVVALLCVSFLAPRVVAAEMEGVMMKDGKMMMKDGKIEMWTLAHQPGTHPERDGRAIRWLRAVESDRS